MKIKACHHCLRAGFVSEIQSADKLEAEIADAEAVIAKILPDRDELLLVLKRLVRSAEIADAAAPNAWEVTLFRNGFRLNVGQVEVLALKDRSLHVGLSAKLGVPPCVGPVFKATQYASMPKPQCAYLGSVGDYADVQDTIGVAHEQYVRRAATTASGQPRKGTPFRRHHHQGLVELARWETGATAAEEALPAELLKGTYREGLGVKITVNKYERDSSARRICLKHFGAICHICGVDLATIYGTIGLGLVHVHHLNPLSRSDGEREVDPRKDLIPVCPNCHAVVHRNDPPLTPEEVRSRIAKRTGG